MSNSDSKEINISDDIDFLLDLCRDLIKFVKRVNPNKDIPIEHEQIAK
ncbi:MAG: hypothetical protein KGD65_13385 [Candidatus Lokiarchaeota archaeon]|nr:hypothetical protein [Candidatus Lokiarchaeota archaeon]